MEDAPANRVAMRMSQEGVAQGHISDDPAMDLQIISFHNPDDLIAILNTLKEKGIPPNSIIVNPKRLYGSWDGQIGYIIACTCKENKG